MAVRTLRLEGQLAFADARRAEVEDRATRIRVVLRRAIEAVGREAVCGAIGLDNSSLTKILDGKGMNIPAELIGEVIALDLGRVFATGIADLAAADLLPRRKSSLEQENAELRNALRQAEAAIQAALGAR